MKDLINCLYRDAINNIIELKRGDMKLSERIKYEKALVQLDIMKRMMDKTIS